MDNELLVKTIRALCKSNNISISQLENDLNFGAGLISRWTKSSPSLDKIIDIANYFHVTLDEVVGHSLNTNDDFFNKLYIETSNNTIKWVSYKKAQELGYNVKRYTITYNDDICSESNYVFQFGKGYVILYGFYEHGRMLNPQQLYLFIQPTEDSDLIEQDYRRDHLLKLWIKALNSLDEIPNEIMVEDFKSSFINDFNKPKKKKKIIFVSNPELNPAVIRKKKINIILNESHLNGNILIEITSGNTVDENPQNGITNVSKDFYYMHKPSIGEILEARLINHRDLYLISEKYIMRLSGFTWGEQCGMHGFNGLLEVLNDAGFDVNTYTNFDGKDITLLPPCNNCKSDF